MTQTELDTLRRRAVAAYQAAELERGAEAERRRAADVERMVAAAARHLERMFGPDALERDLNPLDNGNSLVADVAGARLVVDRHFPRAPRGLVTCPLCERRNCRTVDVVSNLERLGQLVDSPYTLRLDEHETPDDPDTLCDGLHKSARPVPPARYKTRFALTSDKLGQLCNEMDADGYDPTVIAGRDSGWLVLGHRRNDAVSESDPF